MTVSVHRFRPPYTLATYEGTGLVEITGSDGEGGFTVVQLASIADAERLADVIRSEARLIGTRAAATDYLKNNAPSRGARR